MKHINSLVLLPLCLITFGCQACGYGDEGDQSPSIESTPSSGVTSSISYVDEFHEEGLELDVGWSSCHIPIAEDVGCVNESFVWPGAVSYVWLCDEESSWAVDNGTGDPRVLCVDANWDYYKPEVYSNKAIVAETWLDHNLAVAYSWSDL